MKITEPMNLIEFNKSLLGRPEKKYSEMEISSEQKKLKIGRALFFTGACFAILLALGSLISVYAFNCSFSQSLLSYKIVFPIAGTLMALGIYCIASSYYHMFKKISVDDLKNKMETYNAKIQLENNIREGFDAVMEPLDQLENPS